MSEDTSEFESAAAYVQGLATGSQDQKLTDSQLLQFYALYKQATEGPCKDQQPSILYFKQRAKWSAWSELGDVSQADAQQKYVDLLSSIASGWNSEQQSNTKSKDGMGPVFSSLAGNTDEQDIDDSMTPLSIAAASGNIQELARLLADKAIDINECDDSGCSCLHYASDKGEIYVIKLLIERGADINAKDIDGQTPLHYAALSSQEQAAIELLQLGADTSLKNSDGQTAQDLAPESWKHRFR